VYDTRTIEGMLRDIRAIPTVRAIRVHSRAFSHNPFRIDEELCDVLRRYEVTEVAVHIVHPAELTPELLAAADRIRDKGGRAILLAQIPLIKGVNDDAELLRRFFFDLYVAGIKPYYFLHNMPNIPAASSQRTSIRRGVAIMTAIGRRLSHPALPEYIIVHRTGKRTVPLEMEGTSEFRYEEDESGHPIVRFKSWRGTWEKYLDARD
jgi:lysine 2,3-aminomutase